MFSDAKLPPGGKTAQRGGRGGVFITGSVYFASLISYETE